MSNERRSIRPARGGFIKYQHRVLGMLSLLSVITYLDRVCMAVAGLFQTSDSMNPGRPWPLPPSDATAD